MPELLTLLDLPGVGAKTLSRLQGLNIKAPQDLLFHLPMRYEDRTVYTKIKTLRPFSYALIKGRVLKAEVRFTSRRALLVWVQDDTSTMILRYFYFNQAFVGLFAQGAMVEAWGEVRNGPWSMEMIHPETAFVLSAPSLLADRLTPVYPLTKGISQQLMRKLIAEVLVTVKPVELLPGEILTALKFTDLATTLQILHNPIPGMSYEILQHKKQRLVFEELLAHNLAVNKIKQLRQHERGYVITKRSSLREQCLAQLPFSLTAAQQRVIAEIITDLVAGRPMQRLLQGDVGSGKTIVALLAALAVVESKMQVALMAPTEILAEQHWQTISGLLSGLDVTCCLLVSAMKSSEKQQVMSQIADGHCDIALGTHALFQKDVSFKQLALIIVDEQHRFGVEQRSALMAKSATIKPHQLIMTATPIPRTMAMTFYAYLDYSVIDELPPGRKIIETVNIADTKRFEVINRLGAYCQDGHQAYWVCTLIDESDVLQCQTAIETKEFLQQQLPQIKIGLVHGRMKRAEKDQAMTRFKQGDIKILVATTVIEVGVDVPNASLMIIDNAERLGLSQLHQLRGRVGRGSTKSHCILLYKPPLSKLAKARLAIIRQTVDGFKIAERDLELRGPGELLGRKQTGDIKFMLADLTQDKKTLEMVLAQVAKVEDLCDENCREGLIRRWIGGENVYFGV